ncbi:hypothetical protein ACXPWS_22730 [Mycobacterium sp. BMJ-28]
MSDENEPDGETVSEDAEAETEEAKSRSNFGPGVLAMIAVLIAIATLGASAWMWRNPKQAAGSAAAATTTDAAPPVSDDEKKDAKTKLCAAFELVRAGVANSSALQAPGGDDDVVGALAVAANARLALYGGGQYLLARIEPAAPADVADAARKFGNTLMDIGAAAMAQVPKSDPGQDARLKDADAQNGAVEELCK